MYQRVLIKMNKLIKNNLHLKNLSRVRIPENRDLLNGLRLNRNEKVSSWENDILKKIFDEKPGNFLSIYPDLSSLYSKISKFCNIDEKNILVTSGIDGAIKTIWDLGANKGDKVGILSPTYAMYYVYNKIFQTELIEVGYNPDNRKLIWNELIKCIEEKPAILFLPNPNQPIEDNLTLEMIIEVLEISDKTETLVVLDEAYFMFGQKSAIDLIDSYDNLIVMRTLSKGFGLPSIRIGFMASNEKNMEILNKTRFAHEANSLNISVAEYFLDNIKIIYDYNNEVVGAKDQLNKILSDIGIDSYGEYGNYLLIDLLDKDKCRNAVSFFEKNKIYVKGNWSEPWSKYCLVTVGPLEEMDRFIDAIKTAQVKYNIFKA